MAEEEAEGGERGVLMLIIIMDELNAERADALEREERRRDERAESS